MAENLPVGVTIASMNADDLEGIGGISFLIGHEWSFEHNELEAVGNLLKLKVPVGRQFGQFLPLRVFAFNQLGLYTMSEEIQLTVLDNYQEWIDLHFAGSDDYLDELDPDSDVISNRMERALGLNPKNASGLQGAAGLPAAHLVEAEQGEGRRLAFEFTTPLGLHPDLHYCVMGSDNLEQWEQVARMEVNYFGEVLWWGPGQASTEIDEAAVLQRHTVLDLPAEGGSRFLKLLVD